MDSDRNLLCSSMESGSSCFLTITEVSSLSVLFMFKLFVTMPFANDITYHCYRLDQNGLGDLSFCLLLLVFTRASLTGNRCHLSSSSESFLQKHEGCLLYFDTFHLLRLAHDQAGKAEGGQKGWRLFQNAPQWDTWKVGGSVWPPGSSNPCAVVLFC